MEDPKTYIEQETADDALYTRLQKDTLDELQRLSGEVWTDYNEHDPGVTLADAANYVLSELDYKLGFGWTDYLTDEQGNLDFGKYGLFPPEEVHTTAPITVEDYRKLFLNRFPELENIRVNADMKTGNYHFQITMSSFEKGKDIENSIRTFFHAHRNLCENLDTVTIVDPGQLVLFSEFEIETGMNATTILAKVYWTIMRYLSGYNEQADTEHELYLKLLKMDGIKSFKSCYLKENGETRTDFKKGYTLFIPRKTKDLHVRITIENSDAKIDLERFFEKLQALYYTGGVAYSEPWDNQSNDNKLLHDSSLPAGTYRNIFSHYPLGMELPDCYQTHSGNTAGTEAKKNLSQFDAYLKLYDLLVERGLKEVKEMRALFSIAKDVKTPSKMEILPPPTWIVEKENNRYRNVYELKSTYLNFLDGLYGVKSNPDWMDEFNYYGETKDEQLLRRMEFLRHVAELTKNRSGARDITRPHSEESLPAVKQHFCYLTGMNMDEGISVGNVLPSHNLALFGEDPKGQKLRDRLNAILINERMLDKSNIEPVTITPAPETIEEKLEQYALLRDKMDIFSGNIISGGLFRGGIRLNNYKLIKTYDNECQLIFRNEEGERWMNLERGSDKETLNKLANILRRYLRELNRRCETVYVIEHNLLLTPKPFTLSFVFPTWTARFRSPRFREICGQLVRSLVPPHLKMDLYWLNISQMQFFEEGYRLWKSALAKEALLEDRKDIEEGMMMILEESKKKKK